MIKYNQENTEGSLMQKHLTNSKWLRQVKQNLNLSVRQQLILIGTILGDGYLQLSRSKKSARLQICHSKSAKRYLDYLQDAFKDFIFTSPDFQVSNQSFRLSTISHVDFLPYYLLFYKFGYKVIPDNISDFLIHPLSLAIWYMDDGNKYKRSSAYRLSTYAFGLQGSTLLSNTLMSNFDIKTSFLKDKKGYQIYIPASKGNSLKFRNIIDPYIIPSMRYKI